MLNESVSKNATATVDDPLPSEAEDLAKNSTGLEGLANRLGVGFKREVYPSFDTCPFADNAATPAQVSNMPTIVKMNVNAAAKSQTD